MNLDDIFYGIPLGYNPVYQNTNHNNYYRIEPNSIVPLGMENNINQEQYIKEKIKKESKTLTENIESKFEQLRNDILTNNNKSYTISNGDTIYYTNEQNKVNIIDDIPITIKQYGNNSNNISIYPFNTTQITEIKNINIRCSNKTITIKKNSISSSDYILLEIINDIINVWDYDETPRKILKSNGSSVDGGYFINDFNQNKIKVSNRLLFKEWKIKNINFSNVDIYMSNCNLLFDNEIFDKKLNLKIYGPNNNVTFIKNSYDSLNINLKESVNINFSDSDVKILNGELNGNSHINNINILNNITCNIFGLSDIVCKTYDNTICNIKKM
jgi:hypothetical protein